MDGRWTELMSELNSKIQVPFRVNTAVKCSAFAVTI